MSRPSMTERHATDLAYWRERLAGAAAVLPLPTDRPRPPAQSLRCDRVPFVLPAATERSVRRLAEAMDTDIAVVHAAALHLLSARWSRQADVVVGMAVRGERSAAPDLLPIRTRVDERGTF